MQLFNTRNKQTDSNRDDAFHLTSISIVIILSLLGWFIESVSSKSAVSVVPPFLILLETWPVTSDENLLHVSSRPTDDKYSFTRYGKPYTSKFKSNHKDGKYFSSSSGPIQPLQGSLKLNAMDSADFEKLPVFGPILASRTVKFRQALGGFVDVSQLNEVYGIDTDAYEKIESWFRSELLPVTKLCADSASWATLKRHPYIKFQGARLIERFRKHNKLVNIEDLRLMPQMNDSLWGVWLPYLQICSN